MRNEYQPTINGSESSKSKGHNNKDPLGQRKPWISCTSTSTCQNKLGRLETSKSVTSPPAFSPKRTLPSAFSSTSEPSSPTKCQRSSCHPKKTVPGNKEPSAHIQAAMKPPVRTPSAQSPPRRKLLRQSALGNSKESLTGDEKLLIKTTQSTITSSSPFQQRVIRKELIKTPNREPQISQPQSSVVVHHPRNVMSNIGRHNNSVRIVRNHINNDDNNNCGSKSILCSGSVCKDFKGGGDPIRSDYSRGETKHQQPRKKNIKGDDEGAVGRKDHLIPFGPNDTSPFKRMSLSRNTGNHQRICRGVSSETNNVSCQSPSPPLTLIANTQQDNKPAIPPINRPPTSVYANSQPENGLNSFRRDISNSIDTNQCQSTNHLPSSSLTNTSKTNGEEHQPHKSIGRDRDREPTLINTTRHYGQGQPRDQIQLDQRNLQRSLIKKLNRDSGGSGDSKNKPNCSTSMSNPRNSRSIPGGSEHTSSRKSPGILNGTPAPPLLKRSSGNPMGSGIVRRILNKIECKSESLNNSKMNGHGKRSSGGEPKFPEVVQFLQPLPRSLEVLEGSELILTVKATGASRIVWVKDNKIVPNSPPDFEYKSNSVDGTYSLKIRDCFVEDTGVYICEAYGYDSDLACWCNVKVIEEPEDDTSVELTDILEESQTQNTHKFVVPIIITSNASPEPSEVIMEPSPASPTTAIDKRLVFKECREASVEASREIFEDARDTFDGEDEVDAPQKETLRETSFLTNESGSSQNGLGLSETNEIESCEPEPLSPQKNESNQIQTETELPLKSPIPLLLHEQTALGTSSLNQIIELNETTPNGVAELHLPILDESHIHDDEFKSVLSEKIKQQELPLKTPDTPNLPPTSPPPQEAQVSLSTEEESSADIHSPGTRSYSSQSSRESFGGGGGSDTFLRSSFEETVPSPTEDVKSVGSLGSSFRDSFSSTADPRILMGPGNLIVMLGETVNLRVKIQTSDIPGTTVSWCKFVCGKYRRLGTTKPDSSESTNKPSEESSSPQHIQICKTNGETSDLITLRITNANYEDSGKYRVKAQNQLGVDYHQCILSVEGPPEPPAAPPNVSYEDKSHSVLVSWSCCPYDGGSAVTGYVLEVLILPAKGSSEASSWVTLTPSNFQRLCYTLKNPRSGFSYQFRVSVENAYGKGNTSGESEPVVVPEFSGVLVASNRDSLEDIMRKVSLSKDLSDDEIAYEYKDVTLKHESFHEYYDKFEQLGKGRFGVVFKVLNKSSQNPYAGKFVKCIKAKDKERAQLEFQIMNELKYHPKLICLVDAFQMPREIVIVTEMIGGGELFERVVADDFTLTEHDCITFLRQICDGVNYIHDKNIMHLDLKPENILCTTKTSNKIKIIDFGLAQHYNPKEPISVLFGTAEFVSPEIINYDTICPATDMWSVGVITYILLSGLSPFLGDNDNETFSNITRGEFDFEDEAFDKISEDAKEFISSLILKRKEDRLTAKECLSHKWLALSDEEKRDIVLPTDKLKRFLLRRKWQKTGHAIRAIGRITTLYSTRRSSGSSTSSASPMSLSLHRSLSAQESIDDSVFGSVDIPDSNQMTSAASAIPRNTTTTPPTTSIAPNKPKYNDSSRSDSGICDVAASTTPSI